ncbi:unnamed protein product [Caenorhabditis angaria]|uniref:Exosome complex component 10 homolog n=1 Tax=Caenorhabditis angaria TaxID=860376 RepID=A0A9P1IE87_9PELO|nr:unnamed protein product [Caenorhabditis angaria]
MSEEGEETTAALRKQVEELMRNAAGMVATSNAFPKTGGEFEIYNSYPTYNAYMKRQEERINIVMSKLTKSIGCAMRVPNVGSSIQEYTECVIEAQDNIAERASTLLEALKKADRDEVVKVPEFILKAAPTNKKTENEVSSAMRTFSANIGSILAQKFRERREEAAQMIVSEKPQKTYNLNVNNSIAPFISKLNEKHHAIDKRKGIVIIDEDESGKREWNGEDAEIEHPYIAEILNFKIPVSQLQTSSLQKFAKLQNTKFTMVDSIEKLEELRDHLNSVTEFAVDLEHNESRSYLGLTCLIQISTRDADFVIDPFPIWDQVGILNEPFTNPKILKVLHGSDNDVLWLQRDFGIHIVNLFDTYIAMKKLKYPKFSLAYLVSRFAAIPLDKQYQLADWRARPLRDAMLNYAREDTHYLLYCYDNLRESLIEQSEKDLKEVYNECKDLCVKVYKKPAFNPKGFMTDIKFRFTLNSRQEYALTHLYKWRDNIGRDEDESPLFVLPNHMLLGLSETLPNDINGIYVCCNPLPYFVKQRSGEILKIIKEARDVKLEKKGPSNKEVEDAQENRGILNDRMDLITSILYSKLDFSHCKFDEERGEIDIDKTEHSEYISLKDEQMSLLSILRPTITSKNLGLTNVFEEEKREKERKSILEKLDEWVTPYECYKIVMKEKEKQEEIERLEAERLKKLEGDGPKTMFSHNDPTVCRKPVFEDDEIAKSGEMKLAGSGGKSDNEEEKDAPIFDESRFSEDQILSKKSLKRKRKEARRNADISTVLGESSEAPEVSESTKKSRQEEEDEEFDYEKADISQFKKPVRDTNAEFDPFHQKFRLKNQSKKQTMRKSANRQGTINYNKKS